MHLNDAVQMRCKCGAGSIMNWQVIGANGEKKKIFITQKTTYKTAYEELRAWLIKILS